MCVKHCLDWVSGSGETYSPLNAAHSIHKSPDHLKGRKHLSSLLPECRNLGMMRTELTEWLMHIQCNQLPYGPATSYLLHHDEMNGTFKV